MIRFLTMLVLLPLLAIPAFAVNPDEVLDDPLLERRARGISENLRCLVCQNQSIDDSDADLARDLRVLVRERLVSGDSDVEVRDYIVARYGEYVLLNPVLGWHTFALWGAVPLVLLVGGTVLILRLRKPRPPVINAMTDEERIALNSLTAGDGNAL